VTIGAVAAVVAGVVVGSVLAPGHPQRAGVTQAAQSAGPSPAAATPAAGGRPLAVVATTSVDPAGGSGLQRGSDGHYSTQHYSSAGFGGLKPGVGLLLDLGSPQRVIRVSVGVDSPGIGLQLYGLDAPATAPAGPPGADVPSASGTAVLVTQAAAPHRYWLVWIPRLSDDGAGFRASIADPVLTG